MLRWPDLRGDFFQAIHFGGRAAPSRPKSLSVPAVARARPVADVRCARQTSQIFSAELRVRSRPLRASPMLGERSSSKFKLNCPASKLRRACQSSLERSAIARSLLFGGSWLCDVERDVRAAEVGKNFAHADEEHAVAA